MEQMKAVVVGGSNGIGLAIGKKLIDKGYFLEVLDRVAPEEGILDEDSYRFTLCDLLDFEEDIVSSLAKDASVSVLMITAGIGRICDFQYYHTAEIEKTFIIDTVSTTKILRIFYDRLLKKEDFFTGVMGSISGWMSSPSAAVYAAAKASVVRLIESVNIELEEYGSPNRILDVSPSSFKGSRFYGNKNDLSLMDPLAEEIIDRLFRRETRFIPQYEETFKAVLERYQNDAHEYGVHSYNYKRESGRQDNVNRVVIGYLEGEFDPFTSKDLELLKTAKSRCDYLIVGVTANGSSSEERKLIVGGCRYVNRVIDAGSEDLDAWAKNKEVKLVHLP